MNIKRTLSAFLAILLIALTPLQAYAADSDIEDSDNGGTGQGGGDTDSASTWHDGKQGYRFVIADQNLQPVSNIVDITFTNPLAQEGYFNSRLTPLSQDKGSLGYEINTWNKIIEISKGTPVELDSPPPAAIGWPGEDPIAQGLAFKDWFMGTEEFLDTPAPPEHSGGGGGDTGRRISGQ